MKLIQQQQSDRFIVKCSYKTFSVIIEVFPDSLTTKEYDIIYDPFLGIEKGVLLDKAREEALEQYLIVLYGA